MNKIASFAFLLFLASILPAVSAAQSIPYPEALSAVAVTEDKIQGGFAVSADQVGGKITGVRIRSTVGGKAKLQSPLPHHGLTVAEQGINASFPVSPEGKTYAFFTVAGKIYLLSPNQAGHPQ